MNRLKSHITVSPNFCDLQSAYRKGHSTETALCSVPGEIVGSIDNGYTVALMSLDISAAFDAVSHDILMQRLEDEFGVTSRCCQWIASYLTGRSFTVCVGGSTSSSLPMTTGVPQSSVLGPMLYIAYVTLVGPLIASYGVHYHEYADDTQLFTKMSVPATAAIGLLQDCVEALQYWFCLIQANLPLFISAHMLDWGCLSYHHRSLQQAVQWMFQTDCVCWELR